MLQYRAWACRLVWAALFLLVVPSAAFAQATRTWVSGVGDDANPCSRTAPCKTFAGAISKTAMRGIISVLDPGGFGGVTITKSITIDGGGVDGSILVSGTNGITITAGPSDVVRLRNLSFEGIGSGLSGIRFISGKTLFLDTVSVREFSGSGVLFNPTGDSRLAVTNSTISNNGGSGIHVLPSGSGFATVTVTDSRLYSNGHGMKVQDRSMVSLRNSTLSLNLNSGVLASSASQAVEVSVDDCQITDNGTGNPSSAAIKSTGPLASVLISGNLITGNYRGISASSGGDVFSYGSNRIATNTIDGTPSGNLTTR